MLSSRGYAAHQAGAALAPLHFERRDLRAGDLLIEVQWCGVCHSDLHQVRDEWGGAIFPMVPGHEVIGVVREVGAEVEGFAVGDRVGVGCMVDSCHQCAACREALEQYCEKGFVPTYNGRGYDGELMQGGYADNIVVDQAFVLRAPGNLDPAGTAPLLCAGITTYSPLRHWQVGPGMRVGIVGLGGLGHMALKFARAFGAEVTLFTHSPGKRDEGLRLGAHEVVVTRETAALKAHGARYDFILDTVSAPHDLNAYLRMLKRDGTLTLVGLPDKPPVLGVANLIFRRGQLAGSLIGGIAETQEMLDYCGEQGITADVERIAIADINTAYERMLAADVRYRFVIDLSTFGG